MNCEWGRAEVRHAFSGSVTLLVIAGHAFVIERPGVASVMAEAINRALEGSEATTYLNAANAVDKYREKHDGLETERRLALSTAAGILRGLAAACRRSEEAKP